jgi:hypothetical protein
MKVGADGISCVALFSFLGAAYGFMILCAILHFPSLFPLIRSP